jgi:hypothetical protein
LRAGLESIEDGHGPQQLQALGGETNAFPSFTPPVKGKLRKDRVVRTNLLGPTASFPDEIEMYSGANPNGIAQLQPRAFQRRFDPGYGQSFTTGEVRP